MSNRNSTLYRFKAAFVAGCILLSLGHTAEAAQELALDGLILTREDAGLVLHQCSRASPAGVTGFWIPKKQQIRELEMALRTFAKGRVTPWSKQPLLLSKRQYAGFLRGRKRFIYVNAVPPSFGLPNKGAVGMCDGGDGFWGVEYDVRAKRFFGLDFNG